MYKELNKIESKDTSLNNINNDTKYIKVMIVEDISPLRLRYKQILESHENINVISDVDNSVDACRLVKELEPDVILMDIELEEKDSGLKAIFEIQPAFPDIKIIILTIYEDDNNVFNAFRLGACDYIIKNTQPQEIVNAVLGAYNESSPIRPEIASKIRDEFKRVKTYENSFLFMINLLSQLTPKELDTLYLLSSGYTRKDVCKMRFVEMSTLKSQIRSILKKCDQKKISDIIITETDQKLLSMILNNNKLQ